MSILTARDRATHLPQEQGILYQHVDFVGGQQPPGGSLEGVEDVLVVIYLIANATG